MYLYYKSINTFMKNISQVALLAGALALNPQTAFSKEISQKEVISSVCQSNIAIKNAQQKTFILVEWAETGKNRLTVCDQWNEIMTSTVTTGKYDKNTDAIYTREGSFQINPGNRQKIGRVSSQFGSPLPYWQAFDHWIWFHAGKVGKNHFSHGCVRLPIKNAEKLYNIVENTNKKITVIVIGTDPKTKTTSKY